LILRVLKVVCFVTLLQVLILKGVSGGMVSGFRRRPHGGMGDGSAVFMAEDSRSSARGQLVGGPVEVQVANYFDGESGAKIV
jgi:hypothetical protein